MDGKPLKPRNRIKGQTKGMSRETIEEIRNEMIRRRPGAGLPQPPTQEEYREAAFEFLTTGRKPMLAIRDEMIGKRRGGFQDALEQFKKELGI